MTHLKPIFTGLSAIALTVGLSAPAAAQDIPSDFGAIDMNADGQVKFSEYAKAMKGSGVSTTSAAQSFVKLSGGNAVITEADFYTNLGTLTLNPLAEPKLVEQVIKTAPQRTEVLAQVATPQTQTRTTTVMEMPSKDVATMPSTDVPPMKDIQPEPWNNAGQTDLTIINDVKPVMDKPVMPTEPVTDMNPPIMRDMPPNPNKSVSDEIK